MAMTVATSRPVTAAGDPVIAAAGDYGCDPLDPYYNNLQGTTTPDECHEMQTSDLLVAGSFRAVLPLGDQHYCGSLAEYQQAYDPTWGRLKSISHPIPGNHEYLTDSGSGQAIGCDSSNAGAAGYFTYFGATAKPAGQSWYSYDVGAWHLIALNSNCSSLGGCGPTSPQGVWLAADLAAHPNQCTLAYFHQPLFSSGGRASSNGQAFWNLLYAAHADVVLDGHDHIYERFDPQTPAGVADPNGIREFIVGTGGANHTSIAAVATNSVVRNSDTFGILALTLHKSGFTWNFEPVPGRDFTDSGSASCHSAGPVINPPGPPTAVSASAGNASALVSWTAPLDNGGSPITAYTVTSAPDEKTCATTGPTSCTVSGLTNGKPTTFTVVATNSAGPGSASAASGPVTPSAPPPDHLVLSPSGATITAGGSHAYTARGYDSDGDDLGDVTSATTFTIAGGTCAVASCTSTVAGDHTVTGTDGSATGTAKLHVRAAALDHLVLTPSAATVDSGVGQSYAANGYDSYGNALGDVTSATTFTIAGGTCAGATCTSTVAGDHSVAGTDGTATGTATLTVTGVQGVVSGATYHALAPTRVLDTRDGTGGLSGPFTNHVARTFTVAGLPANATAVTGNLTVTGQTSNGYLFIGPFASNNPTSSTLNFPTGDDRANAVTVQLGAGNTLSITFVAPMNGPTAQAIFDVTGYFTPDTSGATYHALAPARVLDTRDGTGGLSGPFTNHAAQTFTIGGLPANTTAVTGNLTVTGQSSKGYLFIGPAATNNPTSSTLNFPVADDRANAVTVALGAGNTLSITFVAPSDGPSAQAIFDLTGYFTADMSGAVYVPLTPTRVLDTRDGSGGLSGPFTNHAARTFTAAGIPSAALAVTGNLTVTGQGSNGYLFIGPVATNNPTSSTLNFPRGDDRANAVTVALGSGSLSITFVAPSNGPTAQAIFDLTGYFTPAGG